MFVLMIQKNAYLNGRVMCLYRVGDVVAFLGVVVPPCVLVQCSVSRVPLLLDRRASEPASCGVGAF